MRDRPKDLQTSSMWWTPAGPQGMLGLSIQSEWVRGAERINFVSEGLEDWAKRGEAAVVAAAARRDWRKVRRFMSWGSWEYCAGRVGGWEGGARRRNC